jgi:hypothetical protein
VPKYMVASTEDEKTIKDLLMDAGITRWKAVDLAEEVYRKNSAKVFLTEEQAERLKEQGFAVYKVA